MSSFHQRLASTSVQRGKSADDFRVAAQKNANAAWFYGVAGGIIWHFFGWRWALIPFGVGIYSAIQSISATLIAEKIEVLLKKPSPH